jgi:hypothetical protein
MQEKLENTYLATTHTTNTIEIPLNFENWTTDDQVMAKYVSPGGQKNELKSNLTLLFKLLVKKKLMLKIPLI